MFQGPRFKRESPALTPKKPPNVKRPGPLFTAPPPGDSAPLTRGSKDPQGRNARGTAGPSPGPLNSICQSHGPRVGKIRLDLVIAKSMLQKKHSPLRGGQYIGWKEGYQQRRSEDLCATSPEIRILKLSMQPYRALSVNQPFPGPTSSRHGRFLKREWPFPWAEA